jgi:N-acetylneuraminic acid mutarotase
MKRAMLFVVAAVLIGLTGAYYVARSAGGQSHDAGAPVGSWTAAAPLPVPEVSQAEVVLADGDVLMTGGEDTGGGRPTPVVQRYRIATGKWSIVAAMRHERIGHTVTLLEDGRVLAVGGLGAKLQPLRSAEIYDPARNRWAPTAPLPEVRFSQSATLLPDGRVLVVGGIVNGAISRSVLIFDPRRAAWTAGPPTISPHAQQSAVTLPGGRVLIAGGYGGKAEVYDPRAGTWTEVGGPDVLTHPVVVRLRDGHVLLATGVDDAGQPSSSSSLFDPKADRWSSAAEMATGRDSPAGAELRDGRVLVAGGAADRKVLQSAEIYDPRSNRWAPAGPMLHARSAASAVVLRNGRVLVCGGSRYGAVLASCELYRA